MADKKMSFEQAMARLEEIVSQLERGDAPLESALTLFEEGTALMKKVLGHAGQGGAEGGQAPARPGRRTGGAGI